MKKTLAVFITGLFITAPYLPCAAAQEDTLAIAADKAVIMFMEGDVKVRAVNTPEWGYAAPGMALAVGYNLKTGPASWAEVGFGEEFGNIIKIKENTTLRFIELGPVEISLLSGEIRSLVESLEKDSTFEVRTPTAICSARGTGWDTNTDGRQVVVDAYEDDVYLTPLSEGGPARDTLVVNMGTRCIIEDPASPAAIRELPIDRIEDWDGWRRDFSERRPAAVEKAEERMRQGAAAAAADMPAPAEIRPVDETSPPKRDEGITGPRGNLEGVPDVYDKIESRETFGGGGGEGRLEGIGESREIADKMDRIERIEKAQDAATGRLVEDGQVRSQEPERFRKRIKWSGGGGGGGNQ